VGGIVRWIAALRAPHTCRMHGRGSGESATRWVVDQLGESGSYGRGDGHGGPFIAGRTMAVGSNRTRSPERTSSPRQREAGLALDAAPSTRGSAMPRSDRSCPMVRAGLADIEPEGHAAAARRRSLQRRLRFSDAPAAQTRNDEKSRLCTQLVEGAGIPATGRTKSAGAAWREGACQPEPRLTSEHPHEGQTRAEAATTPVKA
jgi:hypothetical protein